jgi:pectate lyase
MSPGNSFKRCRLFWVLLLGVLACINAWAGVPAFPGDEGAGAIAQGGRGGRVIEVTSLADSGPGSFREALEAAGPRNVVFRLAGLITLEKPLVVTHPFLTIAGQTAPGDGVCVRGNTVTIDASDVIIRYLRFRRGNLEEKDDCLNAVHSPGRIIIDHCSFSWGLDENVSLYRYIRSGANGERLKDAIENLTIQWCISSECLDKNNHAFGATWGGRGNSFHHNLFASNTARNPSVGWGDRFDLRNNVLFNWRHRSVDGGDATSRVNIVANYYKPGPATQEGEVHYRVARPDSLRNFNEGPGPGGWFIADNYVVGHPDVTADNWKGVSFGDPKNEKSAEINAFVAHSRTLAAHPATSITQQTAVQAYDLVLAGAGATLPRRDAVDMRIVETVRTGKVTFGNGIIKTPADVGGWPEYRGVPPPVDSDHDGMPDAWERAHGFDPQNPADGIADADKDGYTNLEEFLNGTNPRQFVDYTKVENNVNTL